MPVAEKLEVPIDLKMVRKSSLEFGTALDLEMSDFRTSPMVFWRKKKLKLDAGKSLCCPWENWIHLPEFEFGIGEIPL